MKIKSTILSSFLIVLAAFAWSAAPSLAAHGKSLESQANITRAEAEHTALQRVPNGTVREGELEKEHGRLIWSFDIATPGTKNITEIHVDAKTGKVVSETTETPGQESRESATEK